MAASTKTPAEVLARSAAVRIWLWISPGVNHPMDCCPSQQLLERMLRDYDGDVKQASKAIFKVAVQTISIPLAGVDRPLGSCYFPGVADLLDLGAHYGKNTRKVFGAIHQATSLVAKTTTESWGPLTDTFTGQSWWRHDNHTRTIDLTGEVVRKLARAIEINPDEVQTPQDVYECILAMYDIEGILKTDEDVRQRFNRGLSALADLGLVRLDRVRLVEAIDLELGVGGTLCSHSTDDHHDRFDHVTHDGNQELVCGSTLVEKHPNEQHVGCAKNARRVRVSGASFLLVQEEMTRRRLAIKHLYITPSVDVNALEMALADQICFVR